MTLPILTLLAITVSNLIFALYLWSHRRRIQRLDDSLLAQGGQIQSHAILHRSHTRRLNDADAEHQILRAQIRTLNSSTGGFWRTALGTLLQIRQMSDSHIEQCLLYLQQEGSQGNDTWNLFREEQKRRRYDRRMTEKLAQRGFEASILRSPCIAVEAKGTATATQRGPMSPAQARAEVQNPEIDWPEVDRLLGDLQERTVLSSLGRDLSRLGHLLRRGRSS